MSFFKKECDEQSVIEIIKRAINGIGAIANNDESGLLAKSGLSNVVFKENLMSEKIKKDFPDNPELMANVYALDKSYLEFTLNGDRYRADVTSKDFRVGRVTNEKRPDYLSNPDFVSLVEVLGNEEVDVKTITAAIHSGLKIGVGQFNGKEKSNIEETVMRFHFDGGYCRDFDAYHILFHFLAKQLGFIRPSEAKLLNEVFMTNSEPLRFESFEKALVSDFNHTFNVLKKHGHDESNILDFNDYDNFLHYVEKGSLQGVVYRSQNHMFLIARNMETDVIKVWNTMMISDDLAVGMEYKAPKNEKGQRFFDVGKYIQGFVESSYFNEYEYPFEFNTYGFKKSADALLNEFDKENEHLIYDSKIGFKQNKNRYFGSLEMLASFAADVVSEMYGVEKELVVLTDMDINSPEYFLSTFQTFCKTLSFSRAWMLYFLFVQSGSGIFWNGKTFTTGETVRDHYPDFEGLHDYGPFQTTLELKFESVSRLPENMSDDWKKTVFEFAFYMKEFFEMKEENEEEYNKELKAQTNELYETYFNQEMIDKILFHRSKSKNSEY